MTPASHLPLGDRVRRKVFEALWSTHVKSQLGRLPFVRRIYSGWGRTHPFDASFGVETSGSVPAADCAPDPAMAAHMSPYGGSQPSIVRTALASLPAHDQYIFVDLGCGKGRPLLVATEFPFRRIVGIEIAPRLAAIARENAARFAARFPTRTSVEVIIGDATLVPVTGGRVVFFMYHPFERALVSALVEHLERLCADGLEHAFFVYYNPVHGYVLDQSARFSRWSATEVAYATGELGYGPDLSDTVVVWQTVPVRYAERAGARRRILVRESGGGNARVV
jgi:Histone methylation protein DOT1